MMSFEKFVIAYLNADEKTKETIDRAMSYYEIGENEKAREIIAGEYKRRGFEPVK